jgi:ubiquitin C-terminal hydrolase
VQVTYDVTSVVTHFGRNLFSGHYVTHVKRDAGWLCVDDDKVGYCKDKSNLHEHIDLKPLLKCATK